MLLVSVCMIITVIPSISDGCKISVMMIVTALPSISAGCKISICVIITALPIISAGCKISVLWLSQPHPLLVLDVRLVFVWLSQPYPSLVLEVRLVFFLVRSKISVFMIVKTAFPINSAGCKISICKGNAQFVSYLSVDMPCVLEVCMIITALQLIELDVR